MTLRERFRPTIRARLTLVYGGVFLLGGVVLLVLTYVLVKNTLPRGIDAISIGPAPAPTLGTSPEFRDIPPGKVIPEGPARQVLTQVRAVSQEETLNALLTWGAVALALVTVAAVALGWLIADRALRPVHMITETARRVAHSQNLTERIAYAGPRDDVRDLADSFDTMLGRLARAFDGQRRFVANASHELRTPLAINRTLVDVAVRRSDATDDVKRLAESLLVVNHRHERLIDGLLTLADSENQVTDTSPVDLADVADHVLDLASADAAEHGLTVRRALDPAVAAGDPVLLERLVQNLVENAIRHNHDGGEVTVVTGVAEGAAELQVTNTGAVVPPYEVEAIFEPFRRLGDRIRSERGSGLGLSIVRATAQEHGGTVTARSHPEGGLTVTVRLPPPRE
ncbi:MAG: HAMP domain-containing protein [Streptosporangiales bacterium]|nr:HAMP domain-containing protein [Streptosporangiales bacterium]